jgi:hypothetical protein
MASAVIENCNDDPPVEHAEELRTLGVALEGV